MRVLRPFKPMKIREFIHSQLHVAILSNITIFFYYGYSKEPKISIVKIETKTKI